MLYDLVLTLIIVPSSLMAAPLEANDSAAYSNQLSPSDQASFEEGKKMAAAMLSSSSKPITLKNETPVQKKEGCPSQWQTQSGVEEKLETEAISSKKELEILPENQLLVFVSFSMPLQTMKELAVDAEKYNAKLVIRGLVDNSFKKTAEKLSDFQSGLEINPNLFKEFNVKHVPTFISLKDGQEQSRLSGNVSLSYAAEKLKEGI